MHRSTGKNSLLNLALFCLFLAPLTPAQAQVVPIPTAPGAAVMPANGIVPGPVDPTKTVQGQDKLIEKDTKGNVVRETEYVPGTKVIRKIKVFNWYYPNQDPGSVTEYQPMANGSIKTTIKTYNKAGKEISKESWETDPKTKKVSKSNSPGHKDDSTNDDPNIEKFSGKENTSATPPEKKTPPKS